MDVLRETRKLAGNRPYLCRRFIRVLRVDLAEQVLNLQSQVEVLDFLLHQGRLGITHLLPSAWPVS